MSVFGTDTNESSAGFCCCFCNPYDTGRRLCFSLRAVLDRPETWNARDKNVLIYIYLSIDLFLDVMPAIGGENETFID